MKQLLKFHLIFSIYLCFVLVFPTLSHAVIRGAPEGETKVKVGDKAPLEAEDLRKAHEKGKIILLMFGNPDHCIWCEKTWTNIRLLLPQYGKDVAMILKTHRAAKFWAPEDKDINLGEIYGVIGEPWLFLIDREGVVQHVFKGMTGIDEIEAELQKVVSEEK